LSNQPHNGGRSIEWKAAGTILSTADREHLRFEQRGGMLRNILARHVPAMEGEHSENLFRQTLEKAGAGKNEITGWILHAGGRDVLVALQQRFDLKTEDLRWSTAILRDHGNLSSASVLFVLEAALNGNAPGGCWWMSSFGAGFSCHGALLKVD
jgi:alkylresorcinol/alkylpyrone synthase